MAANVNVGATLKFGESPMAMGMSPVPSYTQVGTHAICSKQDANTTATPLAVGDLDDIKYCCLYNPSDSAQTLTVTHAAQVLVPGDACLIRASTSLITLQATGAVTVPAAAAEA